MSFTSPHYYPKYEIWSIEEKNVGLSLYEYQEIENTKKYHGTIELKNITRFKLKKGIWQTFGKRHLKVNIDFCAKCDQLLLFEMHSQNGRLFKKTSLQDIEEIQIDVENSIAAWNHTESPL